MRRDIFGVRYTDDEVRETIRRVYETRGYLLDPHSAIGYLGLKGLERQEGRDGRDRRDGRTGIFLATAHPAKFAEIVEPIVGGAIERPKPLADALARPRCILKLDATLDAVKGVLDG